MLQAESYTFQLHNTGTAYLWPVSTLISRTVYWCERLWIWLRYSCYKSWYDHEGTSKWLKKNKQPLQRTSQNDVTCVNKKIIVKFYECPEHITHVFFITDQSFVTKLNAQFLFCYFVPRPTNAQLFHKLSHSYTLRQYRVILRELAISTLPSYTSISNAAVGNTVYN